MLSTGITEDNRQNGTNVASASGDSDVQRAAQMASIIERLIEQVVKHGEDVRKQVQVDDDDAFLVVLAHFAINYETYYSKSRLM